VLDSETMWKDVEAIAVKKVLLPLRRRMIGVLLLLHVAFVP